MATRKPPPKPSELDPVPWDKIQPHFRAGLRSVRNIAKEFGVSHTAISKHAKEFGWVRDLKPAIMAKADQLVANRAVATQVANAKPTATETDIIEANAQLVSILRLSHRDGGQAYRQRNLRMLAQLDVVDDEPELFVQVRDLLLETGELTGDQRTQLADAIALVASLPARAKVLKDLVDSFARVVGIEREALGMNTADGTDGRPMVWIKDYTGRGDPDSLHQPPPQE